MTSWQTLIDAEPAIYRVTLERPDGRWHVAEVQANTAGEAVGHLRALTGLRDAALLLCDRTGEPIPARVLAGEVQTPRGWGAKE